MVLFATTFAEAQSVNCDSRKAEIAVTKWLSNKWGPPVAARLQAFGLGFDGPIAVVQITDMQTGYAFSDGINCVATAKVNRKDTREVFEVSAKFAIIKNFDSFKVYIGKSEKLINGAYK